MTGEPIRRFIAALAAYLMVLHALGMGAMAAPSAVSGPLAVICSIEADASAPVTPAHAPADHAPCALCGLGACAVAPTAAGSVPMPRATVSIAAPPVAVSANRATPRFDAASPRGPPALI